MDELLAFANSRPAPVLIVGDFNTPPRGLLYRRPTAAHTDAFPPSAGEPATPSPPPARATALTTSSPARIAPSPSALPLLISDHRPVLGEFRAVVENGAEPPPPSSPSPSPSGT